MQDLTAGLERDEFPNGSFARAGLEAHHESNLESPRETLKRGDARTVLARLDSRNGGVARPHPPGELFLGESELGATRDHEPGDPLVWRQTLLRSPVLRIATSTTLSRISCRSSDRACLMLAHTRILPIMINMARTVITRRRGLRRGAERVSRHPCAP